MTKNASFVLLGSLMIGVGVMSGVAAGDGTPSDSASSNAPEQIQVVSTSADGVWSVLNRMPDAVLAAPAWDRAFKYVPARVDVAALRARLAGAPLERTARASTDPVIIELPMPDGVFAPFKAVESPIFEPGLALKFPDIKCYLISGVHETLASGRLLVSPDGVHASLYTSTEMMYITRTSKNDPAHCNVYWRSDYSKEPRAWTCGTGNGPSFPGAGANVRSRGDRGVGDPSSRSGTTLSNYRLTMSTTAQYTAFVGNTVPLAMTAVASVVSTLNTIYEREMATHFNLVMGNDQLIQTDPLFQPYSDPDAPGTTNGENQALVDTLIGTANYDLGHVIHYTPGMGAANGLAGGIGVLCIEGIKGGSYSATDDGQMAVSPFTTDIVAHELGHMFGGRHNFNNCGNGGPRDLAEYAVEPGSGSTIMSYAGICAPTDLQPNSDPNFCQLNFDQMYGNLSTGPGASCATIITTGNLPPTVAGGPDRIIPAKTPFSLTAIGADANNDPITYSWETRDVGSALAIPLNPLQDNGFSPIARVLPPTTSPTRVFPKLAKILDVNEINPAELLPQVSRAMRWRVTVRDNFPGCGGIATDDVDLNVIGFAGPFTILTPNAQGGPGSFTESFESGLPTAAPFPNHGGAGAALTLPSGTWFARNASTPLGTLGVFGVSNANAPFPTATGNGTSYAAMDFEAGAMVATINTYLMTPVLSIKNGDTVSFQTSTIGPSPVMFKDRLRLRLSTAGASTNPADFSTILLSVNPTLTNIGYPVTWTTFTAVVSGLPGPVSGRFAFHYDVPNGGPDGADSNFIGIDRFRFTTNANISGVTTVTWDPALTNLTPINCANVRILLSTDGGQTFPINLLNSTPNNGTAQVVLPNISTTTARLKIEAVDNIFFTISPENLTIQQTPPGVNFRSGGGIAVMDTKGNGNSNSIAEPGETELHLSIPVLNAGATGATGVTGTLTSQTATATVVSGFSPISPLPYGQVGSNTLDFVISLSPSHACGAPVALRLAVNSLEGSGTIDYVLTTGSIPGAGSAVTFNYVGPAVAIPNNDPAGVLIPINVSNFGTIADVNVKFNGTSCSAASNDPNAGLTHTFVGDLVITLTSPQGTTVTLMNRAGGGTTGSSGNNLCQTILDDDGALPFIQAITPIGAPYSGTFRPASLLSAFDGQVGDGTWMLKIADLAVNDTGTLRSVSLVMQPNNPAFCTAPALTGACCVGTNCTSTNALDCASSSGSYRGNGVACSPSPCPTVQGACCSGSSCALVASAGSCTGTFAGAGSVCNVPGNFTTPCCKADYNKIGGVTVQDVFDYLGGWFTNDLRSDINGSNSVTTQDIFDFLAAWFGGCP